MSSRYHNLSAHPLNQVWKDMKQRCYNPSHSQFGYWGGRGISICDEWKDDFLSFYNWAIKYWKPKLQIDRIDNDGNYRPSNCRFVTNQVNGQNTRHCKLTATEVLDIKNLKLLCGKAIQNKEIAEAYNIDRSAISRILSRKRWANI